MNEAYKNRFTDSLIKKIQDKIDLKESSTIILDTINPKNIKFDNYNKDFNCYINLKKINNIQKINKFHEAVNESINNNNHYIICAETLEERRKNVWQKAPFGFKNIVRSIDFIYKRVFPKLPFVKQIYFYLTKGHNRVVSKAEILGRLISCGFEIVDCFEYRKLIYVISKKNKTPFYDLSPSYSPIFKMNRIGYKGKTIGVYKLRTMYPYSEYLQEYIIKENKLDKSGKVSEDYRVTNWGKFCRRFWIDELPMIINFLKGQLNIVGVRPLSTGYFNKYPQDLKDLRIKVKPGLIPPYYADMPKNFNEILDSERKYIIQKIESPLKTDLIYFFRAIINIVFKGARSQ